MGETERREEENETGGADRNSPGSLSRRLEDKGLVLEEESARRKSVAREYAEAIIIAIVLALIIRTFIVQAFKIPSGSMIPTLLVGDHILVWKVVYGIKIPFSDTFLIHFGKPKQGDIIVFKFPKDESKDFIKRIVGEPGDTIEVKNKQVFVNSKPLNEPYTIHQDPTMIPEEFQPRDNYSVTQVPPD